MGIAVAVAAFRLAEQARKVSALVDGLQDDAVRALKGIHSLTDQAQEVMVLVRHEAGAFAQTAQRLRRKTVRAVDRIEAKLQDLETLYDVVHDEIESGALDLAAALRSLRRGNGVLRRVRRMLVPSRG
jgi:exonuclease VII small subunit